MKLTEKLFLAADKYCKQCTWKDMALLKFCLCSIGIFLGLQVKKDNKKTVQICTALVFVATYIPLMAKFVPFLMDSFKEEV